MYRTEPRDDVRRVSQVLAGTAFPAAKWQLIMQAEECGTDAATRAELWSIPAAVYPDLRSVLDAVAAGRGPDRADPPTARRPPRPPHPPLAPRASRRVRPLR